MFLSLPVLLILLLGVVALCFLVAACATVLAYERGMDDQYRLRQGEMRDKGAALAWWDTGPGCMMLSFPENTTIAEVEAFERRFRQRTLEPRSSEPRSSEPRSSEPASPSLTLEIA